MQYEWDEHKRATNLEKHGIDFVDAVWFDWATAKVVPDERKDYGEGRFNAYGYINGRLMVMSFSMRSGVVRIISLRKANRREAIRYGD
ncbi:MAG: BrnT family toxin [Candidatus Latescibacteria bacterium]|nr:BrnT family toxin [Candidatus Latescibacterota bacterium]